MTLKKPSEITNMSDLREQIDALDGELIRLLALRQSHVDRAAEIKPDAGCLLALTTVLKRLSKKCARTPRSRDLSPIPQPPCGDS